MYGVGMMKITGGNARPPPSGVQMLEHPNVCRIDLRGTNSHQVIGEELFVGDDDQTPAAEGKTDGRPLSATLVEMTKAHRVARRRPPPPYWRDGTITAENVLEWIARWAFVRNVKRAAAR